MKNNIKKYSIYITIITLCLLLVSSCNATTKKGWFGEELRYEVDDFSAAEINTLDIIGSGENSITYQRGNNHNYQINVFIQDDKDFDINESWKERFLVTSFSTYNIETIDGLTFYYYHTKSPSIYGGAEGYNNYVTIAIGEKEGHTFYMTNEIWNAGERNDTEMEKTFSGPTDEFLEIWNSIEIND